jgi:hypothetical protein
MRSEKHGYDLTLYTYLYPSTVCKGVGVFALVDISKDTCIFKPALAEKVPWSAIDDTTVIHKLMSLTLWDLEGFWINCDLSRIGPEYYINHSHNPNVMYDTDTGALYAIRDIQKDEELLHYYFPDERDW